MAPERIIAKNPWLQIPLQLIEFAVKNKMLKAFGLFKYLKMYSDGKVCADSPLMQQAASELGIKDKRTLKKYLKQLSDINWVGFNPASGSYFIRSFSFIRKMHFFKKRNSATFSVDDMGKFTSFCYASIIALLVKQRQWYIKKKSKAATFKSGVAFQPRASFNTPEQDYFGVGNAFLAKKLGCKTTMAGNIKREAHENKFLKIRHKFKNIHVLTAYDKNVRDQLESLDPKLRGRLIYRKKRINGKKCIVLSEQLFDEIIPCIELKRLARWNKV